MKIGLCLLGCWVTYGGIVLDRYSLGEKVAVDISPEAVGGTR